MEKGLAFGSETHGPQLDVMVSHGILFEVYLEAQICDVFEWTFMFLKDLVFVSVCLT